MTVPRHPRVAFSHGTWWLRWIPHASRCLPCGCAGTCDPPDKSGRKWIYIAEGLPQREELEVLLHESAHASDPRASEEAIEEQARVQAGLLWQLGWRRDR